MFQHVLIVMSCHDFWIFSSTIANSSCIIICPAAWNDSGVHCLSSKVELSVGLRPSCNANCDIFLARAVTFEGTSFLIISIDISIKNKLLFSWGFHYTVTSSWELKNIMKCIVKWNLCFSGDCWIQATWKKFQTERWSIEFSFWINLKDAVLSIIVCENKRNTLVTKTGSTLSEIFITEIKESLLHEEEIVYTHLYTPSLQSEPLEKLRASENQTENQNEIYIVKMAEKWTKESGFAVGWWSNNHNSMTNKAKWVQSSEESKHNIFHAHLIPPWFNILHKWLRKTSRRNHQELLMLPQSWGLSAWVPFSHVGHTTKESHKKVIGGGRPPCISGKGHVNFCVNII